MTFISRPNWALAMPALLAAGLASACSSDAPAPTQEAGTPPAAIVFPVENDTGVNVDTTLRLTFETPPEIIADGMISVFDSESGELIDQIDMSVPYSPYPDGRMGPSTEAERREIGRNLRPENFQINVIEGVEFLYHPVLIQEDTAHITLHNGALDYDRSYDVQVDGSIFGLDEDISWSFQTDTAPPDANDGQITVNADGSGDFTTLQGAVDFAPETSDTPLEIFIHNGRYDELVFVNNKSDLVFRGESRDGVIVGYPNNSAFNPPRPAPSRRPAFILYEVSDVQLSHFTINNYFIGQAEALLARGEHIIIENMQLNGSGDALTTYGSIYMVDSELTGHGDTILGYASLYCLRCTLRTYGPFTWTRTPEGQHGNVFIDSVFINENAPLPWTITEETPEGRVVDAPLARLPRNGPTSSQINFPHAEMVLINARTQDIMPEGWGPVEPRETFDWSGVFLAEFNTMDMDGNPVDLSQRHEIVQLLTLPEDADLIENYSTPEFVLGGWSPVSQAPN